MSGNGGKDHVDRTERQTNSLGTKAVMSDAQIHFIKNFYYYEFLFGDY